MSSNNSNERNAKKVFVKLSCDLALVEIHDKIKNKINKKNSKIYLNDRYIVIIQNSNWVVRQAIICKSDYLDIFSTSFNDHPATFYAKTLTKEILKIIRNKKPFLEYAENSKADSIINNSPNIEIFSEAKTMIENNSLYEVDRQKNNKQIVIFFIIVFFPFYLVFKILQIIFRLFSSSPSTTKKASMPIGTSKNEYLEKKKKNFYSNIGGIRVLGGLLPKHCTIKGIEIYYDGSDVKHNGSRAGIQIYSSDGNVQVFYRSKEDLEKFKFLGSSVDFYQR